MRKWLLAMVTLFMCVGLAGLAQAGHDDGSGAPVLVSLDKDNTMVPAMIPAPTLAEFGGYGMPACMACGRVDPTQASPVVFKNASRSPGSGGTVLENCNS